MTLSPSYNKILQRAYPELRMRWSDAKEQWHLEQRAGYARLDINPEHYPAEAVDTFLCMRDGYFLSGVYPPRGLPQVDRLVSYLRAHDVRRLELGGGSDADRAQRLADMYDARDEAYRAKLMRDQSFEASGAGAELYDRLAWEEGRRRAVPSNYNRTGRSEIHFGSTRKRGSVPA